MPEAGERGARVGVDALDPRTRLVAACLLAIAIVSLQTMGGELVALGLALALVAWARIGARTIVHRLAHLEGFMLVLLILLPLTVEGRPLASLGPLVVSDRGLERALSIIVTVNATVLTVLALLATLEPIRLGRAMAALHVSEKFVRLFLFIVRYQGVFAAELRRQWECLRARGFAPRLRRHAFRAYGNLLGMILVRSIERAERVDEAMRCRGFSGRFPLRKIRPMTAADLRFGMVAGALALCLLVGERLA
jgi:cobalt/nickel transport system permease protein